MNIGTFLDRLKIDDGEKDFDPTVLAGVQSMQRPESLLSRSKLPKVALTNKHVAVDVVLATLIATAAQANSFGILRWRHVAAIAFHVDQPADDQHCAELRSWKELAEDTNVQQCAVFGEIASEIGFYALVYDDAVDLVSMTDVLRIQCKDGFLRSTSMDPVQWNKCRHEEMPAPTRCYILNCAN